MEVLNEDERRIHEIWLARTRRETEGGEALPEVETIAAHRAVSPSCWYVLWTRSNCEQLVSDQLLAKGLDVFLPKVGAWSRRGARQQLGHVPMFRGYVFVNLVMDKGRYLEIMKSNGLVSILGERWDRLEAVPDLEIETIQRALQARHPVFPHPYLREGQRVRIARGPLMDLEGIFVRQKPNKGLLVVSINMLHRSVAVEVDCTLVAAA